MLKSRELYRKICKRVCLLIDKNSPKDTNLSIKGFALFTGRYPILSNEGDENGYQRYLIKTRYNTYASKILGSTTIPDQQKVAK